MTYIKQILFESTNKLEKKQISSFFPFKGKINTNNVLTDWTTHKHDMCNLDCHLDDPNCCVVGGILTHLTYIEKYLFFFVCRLRILFSDTDNLTYINANNDGTTLYRTYILQTVKIDSRKLTHL